MTSDELLNYIRQSRENGMTDEQIHQSLLNSGWQELDISEALKGAPAFSILRQPEKNSPYKSRKALILGLLIISTLGIGYIVSAKYLFNLWPFEKIGTTSIQSEQTNKVESVTGDFDKKPASFYFMVSEKNEFIQHTTTGGTFNNLLPTLSTILRYDVNPEKKSVVKENLSILTKPDENEIPHVAISPNKKMLVFADVGLLLFEPSSGQNKHFFPQEKINSGINTNSGKINKMELASPAFSPDSEKVAYFGLFYDEKGKESKKQIRTMNIADSKEEILIDNIIDKSGQQFWPTFAIYPVRWFKDSQGEKLLLEKREIMNNAKPLLTTGFLIYDFNKKTTSPITFYIEKGRPIADCPAMSDEFPSGRLSAKCNSIPYYLDRSPDGRYMLLSWLNPSDYHDKPFILDFSVLENGAAPETATVDFQTCGSKTVWSYETGKFICSGFDFSKSILNNSSAVLALEKSDSFTIPYVYRVGDIKTKSFQTIYEEKIEYTVPADVKKTILEKLPKVKAELEKQLDKSKASKDSPEYGQALDYYLGFSINTIEIALKSKTKPVIGWISEDRFITLQSAYPVNDVYQEKPIKQTLLLTDLNGHEKIIAEFVAAEISDQEQVFKKLEDLKVDSQYIGSLKENKAKITKYTIEQQLQADFLGEVIK